MVVFFLGGLGVQGWFELVAVGCRAPEVGSCGFECVAQFQGKIGV